MSRGSKMIGDPLGLHGREPGAKKIFEETLNVMFVVVDASQGCSPVFLPLTCQPGSHKGASAPHPFY